VRQRILERIKQRHADAALRHSPEHADNLLIDFILALIEEECERRVLNKLRHIAAQIDKERHRIMVTADTLKASSDALTAAVDSAIALIGNPGAATPDTVVKFVKEDAFVMMNLHQSHPKAFQSDVDAQTARLNAAEAPPPPAPAPAPGT
jgi:rhamnose utilization protein RhaD (predicted bifunctional aldolase and dehydrogenase)